MTDEKRREDLLDELASKAHVRDCGCPSCVVAAEARVRAVQILDIAGDALRKRGWFS